MSVAGESFVLPNDHKVRDMGEMDVEYGTDEGLDCGIRV